MSSPFTKKCSHWFRDSQAAPPLILVLHRTGWPSNWSFLLVLHFRCESRPFVRFIFTFLFRFLFSPITFFAFFWYVVETHTTRHHVIPRNHRGTISLLRATQLADLQAITTKPPISMVAIMKPSTHSREQTTTTSYTCEGQIQTPWQQRDTTARSGRSKPPKSSRRGRSSGVTPRLSLRTLRRGHAQGMRNFSIVQPRTRQTRLHYVLNFLFFFLNF